MSGNLNPHLTVSPNDRPAMGDALCVDSYRLRLEHPASWLNSVDDSKRRHKD